MSVNYTEFCVLPPGTRSDFSELDTPEMTAGWHIRKIEARVFSEIVAWQPSQVRITCR